LRMWRREKLWRDAAREKSYWWRRSCQKYRE
jgi:hypothetical protein